MAGRVALVGFRRVPPGCDGRRFESFGLRVLRSRKLDGFPWVVLGDEAVGVADPEAAAAGFDGRPERVILCPARRDPVALRRWESLGVTRVCAPDALAGLAALRRRAFRRPATPRHEWTRRRVPLASDLSYALGVLELTRPLDVGVWLARLPKSSETVRRWCQEAFGLSCKGVVRRYRVFLADRMREEGFEAWEIAEEVGYSDASVVCRARREDRKAGFAPSAEPTNRPTDQPTNRPTDRHCERINSPG